MEIYLTTNLVNGKIYIGKQTKNNKRYFGSGKLIIKALKKYGRDNFKKEILEICESQEHLNNQEIFWIKKFNSQDPNVGYNLTDGGEGIPGLKMTYEQRQNISKSLTGRKLTKEQIQHRSETVRGRKRSETTRKKISDAQRGHKRKSMSDETKRKISEKLKGNKKSDQTREKMKKSHIGFKHTEETKQIISDNSKGKLWGYKHSDQSRINMSNCKKGHVVSEETKDKIAQKMRNNNIAKGGIYVNKNSEDKMIYPDQLEIYIENGWKRGRVNGLRKTNVVRD